MHATEIQTRLLRLRPRSRVVSFFLPPSTTDVKNFLLVLVPFLYLRSTWSLLPFTHVRLRAQCLHPFTAILSGFCSRPLMSASPEHSDAPGSRSTRHAYGGAAASSSAFLLSAPIGLSPASQVATSHQTTEPQIISLLTGTLCYYGHHYLSCTRVCVSGRKR